MIKSMTAELLKRYDRPGPRYTSYPTAVEFGTSVGAEQYSRHLDLTSVRLDEPLSLYLHLPFCEERCLYCGCNVVISRQQKIVERYISCLEREIRHVATLLGDRRRLLQLHWGGGTPTHFSVPQIQRLGEIVHDEFTFETDAEVAIEVDPRVTSFAQLETLRNLGFNRLSIGVQDFSEAVQRHVRRIQPYDQTKRLIDEARRLGFRSVNIDLIYGLPLQTSASFQQTLDLVLELDPDRVAVYSYAHIPWIKVQQKRLDESRLPSGAAKLDLIARAIDTLTSNDFVAIGMDHFAKRSDELAVALERGVLGRNFMGYSVRKTSTTVACGMSAISDVEGGFFQNHRKLIHYLRAIEEGRLATARGFALTTEDRLRQHIISKLMCTFEIDIRAIENRFEVDFEATFAAELDQLRQLEIDGLVRCTPDRLEVLDRGRLFVRNVCMVFDTYLERQSEQLQPRFSRTV